MILPILDDLTLSAVTIYMEAGGEPFLGKLGVAWVIVTRDRQTLQPGVADVVLTPWQFSAWNTDSTQRTRLQQAMLSGSPSWLESMKAAAAALFDLLPDPTNGATHYLNPETVLRVAGKMPSWYDPAKITTRIGRHEFLRL